MSRYKTQKAFVEIKSIVGDEDLIENIFDDLFDYAMEKIELEEQVEELEDKLKHALNSLDEEGRVQAEIDDLEKALEEERSENETLQKALEDLQEENDLLRAALENSDRTSKPRRM